MAMNLEFELRKGLQNPTLTPAEKEHLERLKKLNRDFLDENRELIPVSPYEFQPGQVRSLLELDFETIYRIYRRNFANLKFTPAELIRITNVGYGTDKPSPAGFRIDYQVLLSPISTTFETALAYDLGLGISPYVDPVTLAPENKWNDRAYLIAASEQEILSTTKNS